MAFYKEQNAELLRRIDEMELLEFKGEVDKEDSIINELNQSYQQTTKMLKGQSKVHIDTISALKLEIKDLEASKLAQAEGRSNLEYNLRAAEYNVEILKNQLDNVHTESQLLKK